MTYSDSVLDQATRLECELDPLYAFRYFYKQQGGSKLLVNAHHQLISDTLMRVYKGEITRLIINVPPGYSKTEQVVKKFIPWALSRNPRARFLHVSYADELALSNSSEARRVVQSSYYQRLWPIAIRDDADSKSTWITEQGGGVRAAPSRGQITGFRAGHMEPGFQGALLIDDPHKPDDINSAVKRKSVTDNYNVTLRSRQALETTPVILIMQRLHYDDLSGVLLRGGSGEQWHHLELPVLIDNSLAYPSEYTHGIQIPHGLPDGWLWPVKHSDAHSTSLQVNRRVYAAQYQQRPLRQDLEGALWSEQMIDAAGALASRVKAAPIKRTVVGIDPAAKSQIHNDETGIVVASSHVGDLYSVRGDFSGHYKPAEWARKAIWAYNEYDADAIIVETNNGGEMVEHTLRTEGFRGRVINVHASRSKVARAEPVSVLYAKGQVAHDGNLYLLEEELMGFSPTEAKESPNRLDAMVWTMYDLAPLRKGRFGAYT